jgi:hypothetical protein
VASCRSRATFSFSRDLNHALELAGRELVDDALAGFPATEIVIATHPRADSHWLERGLIPKAAARFDVPITELVADSY